MTKYELLTEKMNYCAMKACEQSDKELNADSMYHFWVNAAEGFRAKIENLTLLEAERVYLFSCLNFAA